ncbi:hypothetical protein [uncultured Roseivirga sp.]|uniref:hypothetical protein n=1 Tax=uncultured Roseivirga sp. TaxID=543088 RepID=UPI0030D7D10D
MKNLKTLSLCLTMAISVLFVGCSKDSDTNPGAPTLPPQSSIAPDMGSFSSNQENGAANLEGQDQSNFGFAALNVIFWQSLLTVDLAIPVAAYKEAFNHSFEYLNDEDRWKSEYSATVGDRNITATLYAEKVGASASWKMYLSSEGEFENFLWFSGTSRLDNTSGEWTLFKSPDEPRQLLSIDWENENDTEFKLTYNLVDTESDKEGSYIEYGSTDEDAYTHFYDVSIVSKADEDYDVSILFNNNTKVGRVKSEAHFNSSDWFCWNESFQNQTCGS